MENTENNIYVRTISEGITFRAVKETRFKDACIAVHFVLPLCRETVTVYSVLGSLMSRTCGKFPEYKSFQRELSMLYGSFASAWTRNRGNKQVFSFSFNFCDERFIPGNEKISVKCAELLSDMIFRPAVGSDGKLFPESEVELVLRDTKDYIESLKNNKEGNAYEDCIQIMCEGEPFAIKSYGYLEDLPGITRDTLADAWQRMISTAEVKILMVGGMEREPVERIFTREFSRIDRRFSEMQRYCPLKYDDVQEREVIRQDDVSHCTLVIGMRMPFNQMDDRFFTAQLMNYLYGGGSSGMLFRNVREKMGLCYSVSSNYYVLHGLIFVTCGINYSDYAAALGEIRRQLDVIANNGFTDEEFETCKRFLVNSYSTACDSINSIAGWYYEQEMDGCVRTPKQSAERMNVVTRDQVTQCASLIKMDTVYLLAPETSEQKSEALEGGQADD